MKMDARLSLYWKPLLVFLLTVFALLGLRSPLAAAGRSCADTRQVYAEMGYSTGTAPQTQISGNISAYITRTLWKCLTSHYGEISQLKYIYIQYTHVTSTPVTICKSKLNMYQDSLISTWDAVHKYNVRFSSRDITQTELKQIKPPPPFWAV